MLDVEELLDLEDSIRQELDDCLPGALSVMNRTGELETFLKMLGMEHLLQKEPVYQVYTTGKIIVIGQSDVKAEALLSIAKKLGIDKNRFELYLDYEDAKTFNFKKCNGNLNMRWLWLALCLIAVSERGTPAVLLQH